MYKLSVLLVILLLACEPAKVTEVPSPQTLTRDASGYYCLMIVMHHSGPKGQIFLSDKPQPLWFTSARDVIAFTLSPEEPKNITAIYVNDMTDVDWDNPGVDNWIDAYNAWYVIGSKRAGGMGAPEAIPFSSQESAEVFVKNEGGSAYSFSDIPEEYILETSD